MVNFISPEDIEKAAEEFLHRYHSDRTLPIPIEEILDLKMGVNIVPCPGLFDTQNIDAFLSSDLKDLYIDQDHLEYRYNRARFSLAHETGHVILHGDYISSLKMDSLDEWKQIILGEGAGRAILETQANMFASFLLMPTDLLEVQFCGEKERLRKDPLFKATQLPDDGTLAPFVARKVARVFDVSEEACEYRLLNWLSSERR